ncbi:4-hydroxy-tetrahydrodipicolinate synthase [Nakamurella antarctica]|uniref:4-hydroxy-tetrahydrodipicolinate synthase n=1 Tax=Nakamurella antarctica TaxID=1902245 RepID=A0A3G8ZMQ8_9ACTN|nr:4-hydroxy-tetrahydrodipicolinate synthase [Nakamurella antarctica]AZI58075.1 4-hydroxy-tetrahydrodipicolinate synthase [Nakamurella antarctica]
MTTLHAGPAGRPGHPFGTTLTAMVTPFDSDGTLDLAAAAELATYLVDHGNDGLVLNGTTGECPTTTDAEKVAVIRAVVEAVGDRATIVAGASTYDTAHSLTLAQQAAAAGAHGLLLVTPYYSRPQQAGLIAHFSAIADSTELPVMLYDIPPRSVVAIEVDTLLRLSEHPRITAVKDAKGDLYAGSQVITQSDLSYYSGDDNLTVPWMSVGAVGVVSILAHVLGNNIRAMVDAANAGDFTSARTWHNAMMPGHQAMGRCGGGAGLVFAKAALRLQGMDVGDPRLPQIPATQGQIELIASDLAKIGKSV